MPMDRRSFLKRLGLLVTIPFVPITAIKPLMHDPRLLYQCYRAKATTFSGLIKELREKRRNGGLTNNLHWEIPQNAIPPFEKPKNIILLNPRIYRDVENEIPIHHRFMNVHVLDDGFENFLVVGYPVIHGKYSRKTVVEGKELVRSHKKAHEKQVSDYKRLNNAKR